VYVGLVWFSFGRLGFEVFGLGVFDSGVFDLEGRFDRFIHENTLYFI
jgi:hypothetical protein